MSPTTSGCAAPRPARSGCATSPTSPTRPLVAPETPRHRPAGGDRTRLRCALHRHLARRRRPPSLRRYLLRPQPGREPDQAAQGPVRVGPDLLPERARQPVPWVASPGTHAQRNKNFLGDGSVCFSSRSIIESFVFNVLRLSINHLLCVINDLGSYLHLS